MKRMTTIFLVSACAWPSSAAAGSIDFRTGRGAAHEADANAVLRCRLAMDKNRFDTSMLQAKWKGGETPRIDWSSDAAVIVAPQMYLDSYRPSVRAVSNEQEVVVVRWDFVKEQPDVQPEVRVGSVSTHLSTELGPEVLVVVLSRDDLSDRKVVCRGPRAR